MSTFELVKVVHGSLETNVKNDFILSVPYLKITQVKVNVLDIRGSKLNFVPVAKTRVC